MSNFWAISFFMILGFYTLANAWLIQRNFEQLCSWFRFLLALSSQPLSSKQGVCQAPSGRCTGQARTNPPVKTSLFLFLCRFEMYSYHRNKIASMWHMQGKVTTVLMQVFFFPPLSLNVPEKKEIRRGFVWSVAFSLKYCLRINCLIIKQIYWVKSVFRGLFSCRIREHEGWRVCCTSTTIVSVTVGLSKLPLTFTVLQFGFHFTFLTCLNILLFLFINCFGYLTLYKCIHVYRAVGDMTCWGVVIWFFLQGLMSDFFHSEAERKANCVNVWRKYFDHLIVLNATLNM